MPVEFREPTNSHVVSLKATGRLSAADYSQFVPRIERMIDQQGKISLLFEMADFHGWNVRGAWADLRFGVRHRKDLKRVAMVGDRKWERWMSFLCARLTTAEVRYFDCGDLTEARRWVQSLSTDDPGPRHEQHGASNKVRSGDRLDRLFWM